MISNNFKQRVITSIFLLLLLILFLRFEIILVYSLIIFGVLAQLEFFQILTKIIKNNLYLIISCVSFSLYVFIFCLLFFIFYNFIHLKILLFTILLGCIGSDLGGYFFGKFFKGPKLTKISPKKTFSGAIGSIFFTCLIITSTIFYFTKIFSFKLLIVGVIVSLACQLGDLLFSLLKRKAKMKDTGNFLPGHGGILDRVDGILVGMPFGFLILILIY
tara:strand:+ start:297 stop:947 length:651 start_codon:yes stop_codon:yes gene_type:complete